MQLNVAGIRRNLKNIAYNYSEAQIKVREATSNDPWGPSPITLSEIADLTYNVVEFPRIMEMIWRRLNDSGKNWRHVKKGLVLMEYLVKAGVEKCARQCSENIFAIEALRNFTYYENGKDYGRYVREKADNLVNLIGDSKRLRSERVKALKVRERFARYTSGFGYNSQLPVAKPQSELEVVRPKTHDEEEKQIKQALDMSRLEAQQEQIKRRTDDLRLKLALEQSELDFIKQSKKQENPDTQTHLLDLLDISLGAPSSSRYTSHLNPWEPVTKDGIKFPPNRHMDPWIPFGTSAEPTRTLDPVATETLPVTSLVQNTSNATNGKALCSLSTTSDPFLESVSFPNRNVADIFPLPSDPHVFSENFTQFNGDSEHSRPCTKPKDKPTFSNPFLY